MTRVRDDYLTVGEVADLLGVDTDFVRNRIYTHRLEATQDGPGMPWRTPRRAAEKLRAELAERTDPNLLTVPQISARLGLPAQKVMPLLYEGLIRGQKGADNVWRAPRDEVNRYVRERHLRSVDNPMFTEGREYAKKIKTASVPQYKTKLIRERNEAIVRWRRQGQLVEAIAAAFVLGRQQTHRILAKTREDTQ